MEVFLKLDLNIAAIVLLGIVFVIAYNRLDRNEELNRKFMVMSVVVFTELFLETTAYVIDGKSGFLIRIISVLIYTVIFSIAPAVTYVWYLFVRRWIITNSKMTKKTKILLHIPILINLIITILSPFYGFIFYVDENNIYYRGKFFLIIAAVIYIYLLLSVKLILKYRKIIIKQEVVSLLFFGILPGIGGLFQSLFYGATIMWSSTAFSLVIVYIFLQQKMIHLDSLTGVWTRESFERYISQRTAVGGNRRFGAIYMDLDDLKQINDNYGHTEGDEAIKSIMHIIKKILRKTDIVARLGGDEFIIILDCESMESVEKLIERIRMEISEYNKNSGKQYNLSCSFGSGIFNENYSNVNQFIDHIDNLMYSNKRVRKKYLKIDEETILY